MIYLSAARGDGIRFIKFSECLINLTFFMQKGLNSVLGLSPLYYVWRQYGTFFYLSGFYVNLFCTFIFCETKNINHLCHPYKLAK